MSTPKRYMGLSLTSLLGSRDACPLDSHFTLDSRLVSLHSSEPRSRMKPIDERTEARPHTASSVQSERGGLGEVELSSTLIPGFPLRFD